ncbi:hypothetical protein [Paenibacillus cremeus]|uniref:SPOR domain-containing protein n=1 Tax=Paenibacillus cremeus TaxID=2163881 RepID=A0A559KIK8_9BACL|nr:hypothetical protein [Paenibacillus cremeus]TVY11898.1 hypothetical protein FPZ49_01025 [Paenibacillus cremeus]
MNKAKMTFRFDQEQRQTGNRGGRQEPKLEAKVIPLHSEEYSVVEETTREETIAPALRGTEGGKPAAPEPKFIDAQQLNQYTTDFGGWQSSFDAETQRIESIIRASGGATVNPETGYVEPKQEQEREPEPRPEEEMRDHRWYSPQETAYYSKNPGGGSWLKITTSVAGAVITGVAFGFLVLSMFSGGDEEAKVKPVDAGTATKQVQGAVKPGDATGQTTGKSTDTAVKPGDKAAAGDPASASAAQTASATTGVAVSLPARSYTFLQGGVFSSAQGADTAAADFKKKGLAAAADAGDKFPVYVGMGMNRDEALGLSAQFQQKKIDVLVKPFDIPAVSKIKWNGKQADLFQSYITQGDKLITLITAQTITHLGDAKPAPIDESALQAIKTAHQAWSGSSTAVSDGLGEAGKASLPKMNSALNTAVLSLDEYKKSPSAAYLWQAQGALMQYIVAEKELLKATAVQ